MASKYILFIKTKFLLTIFLSFMFAIIPIRQYRKFVYNYDTNNQGLGLGFADWFFRFQLAVILIIPFLLTWQWLNKEEEIQNAKRNSYSQQINTRLNLGISFVIYLLLGCWLYNFGIDPS
ncbi:MAG: hypothetical protein GPJ54_05425 [Candidatus Heimdallarchaeota archaeon]|nr:hypothetical protein [Candidatus Heimdallarchaeota archaeon]